MGSTRIAQLSPAHISVNITKCLFYITKFGVIYYTAVVTRTKTIHLLSFNIYQEIKSPISSFVSSSLFDLKRQGGIEFLMTQLGRYETTTCPSVHRTMADLNPGVLLPRPLHLSQDRVARISTGKASWALSSCKRITRKLLITKH